MNQLIKCTVSECTHWAQGDNCDLREIWVKRQPGAAQSRGITSAVGGGSSRLREQDTFCASYDAR